MKKYMRLSRQRAILAALLGSTLVIVPATAGIIGPISINENLTINIPAGNVLISITKVLVLVGDPPSVDPSLYYNNYYNPPNLFGGPGQPTIAPNGKMTDVVYPTGDGFPFMGATPHVGFNIIAPAAGAGMLVEGTDLYQTIYKFENSATHNMTTVGAPEVTEMLLSNNDGSTMWRVVFVDATRDGMTTGEYMEVPQGSNAQVLLTNPFGGPITLSNAEFQLSPTQIPLDQLNETSLPSAGPGWTPLPGFPDGTIFLNVPEPSTWAMMLLGFAGLGLVGYRRARASHAPLAA